MNNRSRFTGLKFPGATLSLGLAALSLGAHATTLPHDSARAGHREAIAALVTCEAPRATAWDQGTLAAHIEGSGAQRLVNVPGQADNNVTTDADYGLPEPMTVLGTPVRAFSVITTQTPDGPIREVSALIDQGVWAVLASRAGLSPAPSTGLYERQIGANTLLLRSQSGQTALVCQYDSHRWTRTPSRLWRAIKAPFARWQAVNAAPAQPILPTPSVPHVKLGQTPLPPAFTQVASE